LDFPKVSIVNEAPGLIVDEVVCVDSFSRVMDHTMLCSSGLGQLESNSDKGIRAVKLHRAVPGLDPNNENTLNNSLNSYQIFRLLKLLNNISDCVHRKQL
jgi:hypothetical protein